MEEFGIGITKDEDYQDAAEQLVGGEDMMFGDIDEAEVEDLFSINLAIEQLYDVVYGGTVNA
jgi:hypothetical protein